MGSLKQTALDVISKMPDTVKVDEIMYRLYVIDKVMRGESDIEKGRFVDIDQLRKEIEQW
jgi:predicted transcriptional regulator